MANKFCESDFFDKFNLYYGELLKKDEQIYEIIEYSEDRLCLKEENAVEHFIINVNNFKDIVNKGFKRCKSVPNNKDLISDSSFSDVEFIVDDKILKGHKCVFASKSEYFKILFSTNIGDQNNKNIKLKVPYSLFYLIYKFMYSGQIFLDKDNFLDISSLAEEYMLKDLKQVCLLKFKSIFNDPNLFLESLSQLIKFPSYKEICSHYIIKSWDFFISKDYFYKILELNRDFEKYLFYLLGKTLHNKSIPEQTSEDDQQLILDILDKDSVSNKDPQIVNRILEIKLNYKEFIKKPKNILAFFNEVHLRLPDHIMTTYGLKY